MSKYALYFFLVFLICIVQASAFECSTTQNIADCEYLLQTNPNYVPDLIYTSKLIPDHNFVQIYNARIIVLNAPNQTRSYSSGSIVNAWARILYVTPSVEYNQTLYVPNKINVRSEGKYQIAIPSTYTNNNKRTGRTCRITYGSGGVSESYIWSLNYFVKGQGKTTSIENLNDGELSIDFNIASKVNTATYTWRVSNSVWSCRLSSSGSYTDTLLLTDNIIIAKYQTPSNPSVIFTQNYYSTWSGNYTKTDKNVVINQTNGSLIDQKYSYSARFIIEPYNFLQIYANESPKVTSNNIVYNPPARIYSNTNSCTITSNDFFTQSTNACTTNSQNVTNNPSIYTPRSNWGFLLKLLIFFVVLYALFQAMKKTWGKVLPIILFLAVIPSVSASDCGLSNLGSCLPEMFMEYLVSIANATLQPLISAVQIFLTTAPLIDIMIGIWAIIIYCLSLFYGLMIMWAGLQFLVSGFDVQRRQAAKEWLQNTILMIVLVQGSFYLYGLILDVSASLTSGITGLIDPQFFLLTTDNNVNIALQFIFAVIYALILVITLILLGVRYSFVTMGVLFFPLGIFCYYVAPLRSYGRLILQMLMMLVFVTVIDAVILLGSSMLLTIDIFQNFKILVMIGSYCMVLLSFIILGFHIITKSGTASTGNTIITAVKWIGGLF